VRHSPRSLVAELIERGDQLRVDGRYPDADRVLRDALERVERCFGPTDPQVAVALNALAVNGKYAGRFAEAEALLERALTIVAPGGNSTATLLHNLAGVHHARRDFARAVEIGRRGLAVREHAVDASALDVAADRAALAAILDGLGEHRPAADMLAEALETFEAHYGDEHYEVAVVLNNLGACHHRAGDVGRAEALYERALAIKVALLGSRHPDVAITRYNLAVAHVQRGRDDEASVLVGQALAVFERAVEPDHPTLGACRAASGMFVQKAGTRRRQDLEQARHATSPEDADAARERYAGLRGPHHAGPHAAAGFEPAVRWDEPVV
jgi:tetratricopeptide (TPR) repeat protein